MNKDTNTLDLIIIGAGPAGLMAAIQAGRSGVTEGTEYSSIATGTNCSKHPPSILIMEKKSRPGRKLLMAGSGRCNISHAGDVPDYLQHYGELSGSRKKILKSVLYGFPPDRLAEFFSGEELPFKELNEGKLFPMSERSVDVLKILVHAAEGAGTTCASGASISCGDPVAHITHKAETAGNPPLFLIKTESGTVYDARSIILATGGSSWPKTGSNGDGFRFAEELGHTIVPLRPALTSIGIEADPFTELSGISLPVTLKLFGHAGKAVRHTGEVLFTHSGLSGPVILNSSRFVSPGTPIEIAFTAHSADDLQAGLIAPSSTAGGRTVRNELRRLDIPDRFVRLLLFHAGVATDLKLAELGKKPRQRIIRLLTAWPLKVSRVDGWNTAMVTAGGIELSEVNPNTLESRLVPGLFFAGEILDIDGDEGGYNLQFAFSSGAVAGRSALRYCIDINPNT